MTSVVNCLSIPYNVIIVHYAFALCAVNLSADVFHVIDGVKFIHWFCDDYDGLIMGYIDKFSGGSVKQVIESPTVYIQGTR